MRVYDKLNGWEARVGERVGTTGAPTCAHRRYRQVGGSLQHGAVAARCLRRAGHRRTGHAIDEVVSCCEGLLLLLLLLLPVGLLVTSLLQQGRLQVMPRHGARSPPPGFPFLRAKLV